MSRAFLEEDQSFDATPRVYVNNMNTPHANVGLPQRRFTGQFQGINSRGASASRVGTGAGGDSGGNYTGAHTTGSARNLLSSGAGGQGGGASSSAAAYTTARGDVVHANLQNVYNRIMRRLQRQMNYEELSRATLAEQYGVDLELQIEEAAASDGVAADASSRSPQHSPSRQGADAHGVVSRRGSGPFGGELDNNGSGRLPHKSTYGGGGGGTSRLLQFKEPPMLSKAAAEAEMDVNGPGTASDYEAERTMAEQPCPRPLRLVIEHVLDTLQKKMTLAQNGSLRECIIFSFESRALLDRLLKEIPLYTQYTAHPGASLTSSSSAVQQAMAGVFQQLRKRPVLLPRGGYVEEPTTGAIRAELVSGAVPTGAAGAAGESNLPFLNASTSAQGNGAQQSAAFYPAGSTHDAASLPEVPLPAGYGKSTRLAAAAAARDPFAASTGSAGRGKPGSASRAGAGSRLGSRPGILRDHLSSSPGGGMSTHESFHNGPDELSCSNYTDTYNLDTDAGAAAGSTQPPPPPLPSLSGSALAHRATQLVSVGTITDENAVTTVPQADYLALQRRAEELQTQLADVQQHRDALTEQLCEEEQYTNTKKRIVQYLRETLVRECNMLRTQLHHAASNVGNAPASTGGRGGGGGQLHLSRQLVGAASSASTRDGALTDANNSESNFNNNNASATVSRTQKPTLAGANTTAATTATGPLSPAQHRGAAERSSTSGSMGSMYGSGSANNNTANFSVGGGRGNATVKSPKKHQRVSPGGGGKSSVPNLTTNPGHHSSGSSETFHQDVEAVQSLLDLALLAVEEEAVLPPRSAQLLRNGLADKEGLLTRFRKTPKQQQDELRAGFEGRQQALKKTLLQQTAEHNYIIAEQQREVTRLRALTDTTSVHGILRERVAGLRAELQRTRMQVAEQLHFFKSTMHNTGQALMHRAGLVDSTMSDNLALGSTLNAIKELIESANTLFLPMITREYECGYHPWPLKLRNTTDPLSHIIHLRFGPGEVVRLREPLSQFGKLYVALHQYVMRHAVLPESARPAAGKPLRDLCAALALNPTSHTDTVFAARRCYDVEGQLRKRLAVIHSRLLWNGYQQRIYTDRSVAALVDAGIDPRLHSLPVARRVNRLAQQRAELLQARVTVQRERADNAKEAFRLWREKEIDIMEGYPTPQTQRNRLQLLSGHGGDGGPGMNGGNGRSSRYSKLFQRASMDNNSSLTAPATYVAVPPVREETIARARLSVYHSRNHPHQGMHKLGGALLRCRRGGSRSLQLPLSSAVHSGLSTSLFAPLCITRRCASSSSEDGSPRREMDVDSIARPMGYGPFSATAKARVLRERAEASAAASSANATAAASPSTTSTVMHNVSLDTNLFLRLSLAGLPHPSQLQSCAYMSAEWRAAFVRLYRTILRLHNKTVAVSLRTARGDGPEAAVAAVTGVKVNSPGENTSTAAESEKGEGVRSDDDCLLRYLLTPEQQEFGNRFVQGEFQRHMDADAVSASIFYASWYDYVLQLASGVTARELTEQEKRLLSSEQKEKLNALRGAFVDLRVAKTPQYLP